MKFESGRTKTKQKQKCRRALSESGEVAVTENKLKTVYGQMVKNAPNILSEAKLCYHT